MRREPKRKIYHRGSRVAAEDAEKRRKRVMEARDWTTPTVEVE
jgi:hypothetical protein